MSEWSKELVELADDPAEFTEVGGEAFFTRHGQEFLVHVRSMPGLGLCIDRVNGVDKANAPIAFSSFIQDELLKLPRLAKQVQKALDGSRKQRPVAYVDGPSRAVLGMHTYVWTGTKDHLQTILGEFEPGSTRIIQLMARAGQGKTVLLEEIAAHCARTYRPDNNPIPLVLLVDLLGRYVGSIDDAIAGALNNTYLSPGMSQRDVVYCMRKNWLVLALDGFDELAARIGARDAFLRISDLVDQLAASGTVVLSARESFFELHRISASIRTYLQPKLGTYATASIQLEPWSEKQGRQIFAGLGQTDPEQALIEMLRAFDDDADLVLQPFFLTRLAKLWVDGERFEDAKTLPAGLGRLKYVIEAFVQREVQKWKDRDGNEILSLEQHVQLLASIAEEMWRSGAFRLTSEEVQVTAEVALESIKVSPERRAEVMSRVATHGAFVSRDQRVAFLHDRFFDYFFAVRAAQVLLQRDASLAAILKARQINHSVVEWIVWMVKKGGTDVHAVITDLLTQRRRDPSDLFDENAALLAAGIASDSVSTKEILFADLKFTGDALRNGKYRGITFLKCAFWQVDFSDTKFAGCRFDNCQFSDVLFNSATDFGGSIFNDQTLLSSIEIEGQGSFYAPSDIEERLQKAGAVRERLNTVGDVAKKKPLASRNLIYIVERFLRASERTTDVAIEDMESQFGDDAMTVAKVGIRTEVLKKVSKDTSGPKKSFVRFQVGRDRLLQAQMGKIGDDAIDFFWSELAKRSR